MSIKILEYCVSSEAVISKTWKKTTVSAVQFFFENPWFIAPSLENSKGVFFMTLSLYFYLHLFAFEVIIT